MGLPFRHPPAKKGRQEEPHHSTRTRCLVVSGARSPLCFSSLGFGKHGSLELETGTIRFVQTQTFEWCRWEVQGMNLTEVSDTNFFMHGA